MTYNDAKRLTEANNWIRVCSKNVSTTTPTNVFINGIALGSSSRASTGVSYQLTINHGTLSSEMSDFAFSHVLIWNVSLTDIEMATVSNVLQQYLTDGIELYSIYTFRSTIPSFISILSSKPPVGVYSADSWNSATNTITDLTYTLGPATTSGVSISDITGNGASPGVSIKSLTGTTTSIINFPTGSIPKQFTMASLTRYNSGSNRNRILTSPDINFVHGHKANVTGGGVFYVDTWLTSSANETTNNDWLYVCSKTGGAGSMNVFINGVAKGVATREGVADYKLCVNNGTSEKSDFAFSYVMIWNQQLTDDELMSVSNAFKQYLADGIPPHKIYNFGIPIKNNFQSLITNKPPVGVYCAELWEGESDSIQDLTYGLGTATTSGVTSTTITGNGASSGVSIPVLTGTTSSKILFPAGSLPRKYTIASLTRYNTSANRRRILGAKNTSFVNGQYSSSTAGGAYYNSTWLTNETTTSSNDWLFVCSKNVDSHPNNVLVNGVAAGIATSASTDAEYQLTINDNNGDTSDFAFSYLMIWDQLLSNTEMATVSNVFSQYLVDGIRPSASYSFKNVNTSLRSQFQTLITNKPPVGVYSAKTWNSLAQQIPDLMNTIGPARTSGVSLSTITGNGASVSILALTGTTTSQIIFPDGSIPGIFTMASLTRYNGDARYRILTSSNINLIHGHHSQTTAGGFHYSNLNANNWITSESNITPDNNWLYVCSKNGGSIPGNVLINGKQKGSNIGLTTLNAGTLSINTKSLEESDFAFSYVMIWNQTLTDDEMVIVSDVLKQYLIDGIELPSIYNFTNSRCPFSTVVLNAPPLAIYSANSWISGTNTIPDLTNRMDPATTSGVTSTTITGNGASSGVKALTGTTTSKILFPAGSLPRKYTIASLTRYNTSENRRRILGAKTISFVNGQYSTSTAGGAYYNSMWLTNQTTTSSNDWLFVCSKNVDSHPNNVLVNGVAAGTATSSALTDPEYQLTINDNHGGDPSDFAFSYLMIWDQPLSNTEMVVVSNVLKQYLENGVELINRYPWLFDTSARFKTFLENTPPWGVYSADSITSPSTQLPDLMGKQSPASVTAGTLVALSTQINNSKCVGVSGTNDTKIEWPIGSIPTEFTICSLTRYTSSANQRRILQSIGSADSTLGLQLLNNWLHGHHSSSRGRIFYQGVGGVGAAYRDRIQLDDYKDRWLVCCSSNSSTNGAVIADGRNIGKTATEVASYPAYGGMTLNINGLSTERSDFGFSYLFIWDKLLTTNEMIAVHCAFNKYLYLDGTALSTYLPAKTSNFQANNTDITVAYSSQNYPANNNNIRIAGYKYRNNPIFNTQFTPYTFGSRVASGFQINGEDTGMKCQVDKASYAVRCRSAFPTGAITYAQPNILFGSRDATMGISSTIWKNYISTYADVGIQTLYFATRYINTTTSDITCTIKAIVDNFLFFSVFNESSAGDFRHSSATISTTTSISLQNMSTTTFALKPGINHIFVKALNGGGPGYVRLSFFNNSTYIFGTSRQWYVSESPLTYARMSPVVATIRNATIIPNGYINGDYSSNINAYSAAYNVATPVTPSYTEGPYKALYITVATSNSRIKFNKTTTVYMIMVGGGGSKGTGTNIETTGGSGGGIVATYLNVVADTEYTIVVGTGGSVYTTNSAGSRSETGNNGTDSTFGNITAPGGFAGSTSGTITGPTPSSPTSPAPSMSETINYQGGQSSSYSLRSSTRTQAVSMVNYSPNKNSLPFDLKLLNESRTFTYLDVTTYRPSIRSVSSLSYGGAGNLNTVFETDASFTDASSSIIGSNYHANVSGLLCSKNPAPNTGSGGRGGGTNSIYSDYNGSGVSGIIILYWI